LGFENYFLTGTVRRNLTGVESGTILIDRYFFTDILLDPIYEFIPSPAIKEHKIVKRYIIQIYSHHFVIFKSRRKFVVVALEAG
jgi:hypothetical protein